MRILVLALATVVLTAPAAHARQRCPAGDRTLLVKRTPAGKLRARIFEQDGKVYACLRGRRAHRLAGPPERSLLTGTQLVYTVDRPTGDRVAAIDLRGGTRWLRARPAIPSASAGAPRGEAQVLRLRSDRLGAMLWSTDTGHVAVAAFDGDPYFHRGKDEEDVIYDEGGAALVDVLPDPTPEAVAALARSLTIETGYIDTDGCGINYDINYRWTIGGERRSATSFDFESVDGCD